MNALFIAAIVCSLALANAVPSGLLGLGLGVPGATVLAAPSASAIVSGPGLLGGAVIGAPALGGAVIGARALGLGGLGVITNGGGAIGVSGLGATVRGPPTAPAVISGPSGTVAADGLWGPTGAGVVGPVGVLGHGW